MDVPLIPQYFQLYELDCFLFISVQSQSCPTLCNPMDYSTPGLTVHHQLPEFTQTHVHRVGDAIQPSHPLSSLSPPSFNLSQHQGLFKWVSSSRQVAKVLEFQLQHQSFQWSWKLWKNIAHSTISLQSNVFELWEIRSGDCWESVMRT